jgi:hypothetical protein
MSDKLVERMEAWANSIAIDGTPSQIGPTPEDLHAASAEVEALEQRVKVLSGLLEEARDIYVDECFGRGDNEFKARIDAALSA